MRVSVALCTHQGSRFVTEQVESILGQTVLPDEVVLSDDASSDDTVERVEAAFADQTRARDDGVHLQVLRNERPLGVVANFQQAALAATGDLIFLSDQDDSWRPEKVERMRAEFLARPGLLLLHTDALLVDERGESLGHTLFDSLDATDSELAGIESGSAFRVLLRRNLALGASMAFRRELLRLAVPFGDGWVHDEWLAIIAASQGRGAVGVLREKLIDYRQHGSNQIGARKLSWAAKFSRLGEPRGERNDRLMRAAESLADRLRKERVSPEVLASAEAKAAHERARSGYPVSRWRRLRPIVKEVRTGRYSANGRGTAAVAADILQSAK